MTELFPLPLAELVECAERELGYRRRVYPRRIEARQMSRGVADREIARMEAIRDLLKRLQQGDKK